MDLHRADLLPVAVDPRDPPEADLHPEDPARDLPREDRDRRVDLPRADRAKDLLRACSGWNGSRRGRSSPTRSFS